MAAKLKLPAGVSRERSLKGFGEDDRCRALAWSPDGARLAAGFDKGAIRVWDARTWAKPRLLRGHSGWVHSLSWSPDGRRLASGSGDKTVGIWKAETGRSLHILKGHANEVNSAAWSPDGRLVASASDDETVKVWDPFTGDEAATLEGHSTAVNSVAWSPDGSRLASGSDDRTVRLWQVETFEATHSMKGGGNIWNVAWSPDSTLLASTEPPSVRIWEAASAKQLAGLEGHSGQVLPTIFSPDGRLLASGADDGDIRLWRCDTWACVATVSAGFVEDVNNALAWHPTAPLLAASCEGGKAIYLFRVDLPLGERASPGSVRYSNAKVVLVGDSGVGKTGLGLGLGLSGKKYRRTDSTHKRNVWTFQTQKTRNRGQTLTRETLLWDLAGQPGYRLVHQLSLNEVAVALVVFDAKSETDLFAGLRHWDRALRQAQRAAGDGAPTTKKILVAARTDRGRVGVSRARINEQIRRLGFDAYLETSAKEGLRIDELKQAIRKAIDWDALPVVSSDELFQRIKEFLIKEKKKGRVLSSVDDLYRLFLESGRKKSDPGDLRTQFDTCIRLVQSRGLIRRLSFGGLVLLQPEYLDSYAAAMVNAARDEPDGLGSLREQDARQGRFPIPTEDRVADREQEKLLLIATVEELLENEIALREDEDLVFPAQFTRDWPEAPDPPGKVVVFRFDGSVLNLYATLAVRLSHSGVFTKDEMWKNAATFRPAADGRCGVFLHEPEEGSGELTLFFDKETSEPRRLDFERYVETHLLRRALPESVVRWRIFVCPGCETSLTDQQVKARQARGFDQARCSVCDTEFSLLDRAERVAADRETLAAMDRAADEQRDRGTAKTALDGKLATNDFDVFLSYKSSARKAVREIAEKLKGKGILPWLDVEQLRPGKPWQKALEAQIETIKSTAVFVGKDGQGPWQELEIDAFLREFVKRECPVIPVALPSAQSKPSLPVFLGGMHWVDFREDEPDPLEQLIFGITGERNREH